MSNRILIADDDPTIRMLLRRLVGAHPPWEVCGEAETGSDAVQKTASLAPDLVILDLAMPAMNGLQAAREIGKSSPGTLMLLVSVQQVSRQLADAAERAGFRGAVTKASGSEVMQGIAALFESQTFFAIDDGLPA
jgi:DNA-binding NarL/FixJ family response regulator